MAIETIGSLNHILQNHSTSDWMKSSKSVGQEIDVKSLKLPSNLEGVSKGTPTFGEVLAQSIGDINNLQQEANKAIERLATGKEKNIHETMLAVEKAEIAFKSMNQIRMKVIDAYKEIMKMQI